MAEEEVARCVVDNDNRKCKDSSAGDDAFVAVLFKSPATRKRPKWCDSAFEELFMIPSSTKHFRSHGRDHDSVEEDHQLLLPLHGKTRQV